MKRFLSIWPSSSYWLSSLFLITGLSLAAQEPLRPVCSEMIQEGKNEESAGNLDAALKAYLNALNCDSKLAGTVGPRIDTVFALIQQQKKTAEYNQELAERRLVEVEKQKNIVNSLNDLREFRSWGDMWFDNQNWEKAADNYEQAAAIDPNDPYLAERVKICASDQRDTIFSLLNGIRQRSLDPDRGDFFLEQTRKKQIFLNATIGLPNPMGTIQYLRNSRGAVAITFLIAGNPGDETAGFEDGDIYQTHPHWFWAFHTGKIPGASSRELSKHSIAINLCNWGALVKNEDGTFSPPFLQGRVIVPREEVIEYEMPYRGYVYYHRYTDKQVESLRKLLIYLTEVYDIPKDYNDDMFELSSRALEGTPGIFSQASIRKDKPGLHPQPELIAALRKVTPQRKSFGSKQAFFRTKPHFDIAVIYNSREWNPALSAAMAIKLGGKKQLPNGLTTLPRAENSTVARVSFLEYESQRGHYSQANYPSFADFMKDYSNSTEAAIFVLDAESGISEATWQFIALTRGLERLKVIFFIDGATNRDEAEEVERQLRELLSEYEITADRAPILRGDAALALSDADNPEAVKGVETLIKYVDQYLPIPARSVENPFLMPVESVNTIEQGTVVDGRIERGFVASGQKVEIVGWNDSVEPSLTATVKGVEMFRKILDRGEAGDNVGLLLDGVDKTDIQPGMVIVKPGTASPHRRFRAFASMFEMPGGEPEVTLRNGDTTQFYLRTADFSGTLYLSGETTQLTSENPVQIEVEMSMPVAIEPGLRLAIRRDGKTIGVGVVSEILE